MNTTQRHTPGLPGKGFIPVLFTAFALAAVHYFQTASPHGDWSAELAEMSDAQYPDNPDLENRHPDYPHNQMEDIRFTETSGSLFHLQIVSEKEIDDTVWLHDIDLQKFIPTIPAGFQPARQIHVWLLSFERHSLMGHYVLDLEVNTVLRLQVYHPAGKSSKAPVSSARGITCCKSHIGDSSPCPMLTISKSTANNQRAHCRKRPSTRHTPPISSTNVVKNNTTTSHHTGRPVSIRIRHG